ncbi:MAG: bifunctional metallophosphatase/5'-nucleotidase [Synergistaceae bacterium]|nr:bifunctional metallophosphatase/5'-nucleotidase [Synergistaceae bacterium]
MQKLTPYVILADAGDWASGGTIGTISQGGYIVEIMNAVKYNVAVPGNHEFDFGMEQFKKLAASLDCGLTACNFRDLRTGELVLKPYKIFEYGGVKVAFIGAATPDTFMSSSPSYFKDKDKKYIYSFSGENNGKKLYETIQNTVDEVRAKGADYVIVLGHLGEYKGVTEHWSAPVIAANTRGIDAFIDGHSHEVTPELKAKNLDGKDVIITQTGTKLNYLGKMTINTEGKISTVLLSSADIKAKDEKIVKLIEDIKAKYEGTLEQKLSHTDFDLSAVDDKGEWLIRNSETGLCNLVTDALFASAAKTPTGKADIALLNSGGIRANIKAGDITLQNIFDAAPFINYVCIVEVSGQSILDDLEIGARSMPGNNGGLLHAAGMTYRIDTSIPTPVIMVNENDFTISGDRRVCDVYVNGEPIDPKKIYKVISLDYVLLENGNGHVFKGAKMIEPPFSIAYELLGDYVSQFETLPEKYKESQGRIKIK